ncbi:MAG: hypothetical protein P4L45_08825 [Ignavibacteriaceae bacterium]|nr:hypothetical protein [Ignavibacteriaceae bacterium]
MKKLIIAVLASLVFSGCLNYIQDVQLYADGSGSMKVTFWTKMPDNESNKILDKVGIFNVDSLRHQFSSNYVTIKKISVYVDSTDSTNHAIIDLTFNHIDSLNKTKAFLSSEFSLKNGAEHQKIFTQFIPPITTGFGVNSDAFHVTYKYTFGGDIITDNCTAKKGRTLIWDYSLAEIGSGKTISVTFRPFKLKETPPWIYALSGLVLLIVIIFLLKKKKD